MSEITTVEEPQNLLKRAWENGKRRRKARESRLRRLARRLGYRLSKSSTRLRYRKDFRRYTLIYYVRVPRYVEVSQARYLDSTRRPSPYLTLDDVEDYLNDLAYEDEDEDEDDVEEVKNDDKTKA